MNHNSRKKLFRVRNTTNKLWKCRVHSLEEWNAAVSMFQRQGFRWRGESKTGLLSHNFEPGRFNGLIVAEEMIHFTHDEEFFESFEASYWIPKSEIYQIF